MTDELANIHEMHLRTKLYDALNAMNRLTEDERAEVSGDQRDAAWRL